MSEIIRYEILIGTRLENRCIVSNEDFYGLRPDKIHPTIDYTIKNMKRQLAHTLLNLVYSPVDKIMDKFEVVIYRVEFRKGKEIRRTPL